MAFLEYITYEPWREVIGDDETYWISDAISGKIVGLPQIFWGQGEGWAEANHWALEKASNQSTALDTVKALMKHLNAYANFLEEYQLDWRHFPMRLADRAITRFRGELIEKIRIGSLTSSTARARMGAVIQFYRHADINGFVTLDSPMWREKSVVIKYFDAVGFKRSMSRVITDLAITNRSRPGIRLESGLLPLSESHMSHLLDYTRATGSIELHLMLTLGFFTGARLGTITTLRIENIEQSRPDPFLKEFWLLRVGPGSGVATKLNVEGDLLVPEFLLAELKSYAYSTDRLKREAKAGLKEKSVLFLTIRGKSYSGSTINRLMTNLRRNGSAAGLNFMGRFRFHQTRATYGTWLMRLALSVTSVSSAIEFVRQAMLHKHEATTFAYIRFLEQNKGKQEAAQAFNKVFTGLQNRDWNQPNA